MFRWERLGCIGVICGPVPAQAGNARSSHAPDGAHAAASATRGPAVPSPVCVERREPMGAALRVTDRVLTRPWVPDSEKAKDSGHNQWAASITAGSVPLLSSHDLPSARIWEDRPPTDPLND
jgi:hypothetical protein